MLMRLEQKKDDRENEINEKIAAASGFIEDIISMLFIPIPKTAHMNRELVMNWY